MPRGNFVLPVRRPRARPVIGVAVAIATTMLVAPVLLAAGPADTAAPDVPVPSPSTQTQAEDLALSALVARDEAQASRGQSRASAEAPAAPEPSEEPSAPAPSASAAPEPEPVATPEPTPPPPPPAPAEPPAVVGNVWATTDVNVRTGPSAGTERVGHLAAVDEVGITGTTEDGWTQVVLDGRVGWVKSSYLAETKPEPEPAPAPAPAAQPAPAAAPQPAAASGSSDASCSINPGIEPNLNGNARAVYRAVCAAYGGSVSGFGGYRPGDGGDHGSGRAVDVMVSGAAGWEISRFLQARAGELGITYVIYEQQIWMAGSPAGAWEWMEDRGGATANHFDHVHVSVR